MRQRNIPDDNVPLDGIPPVEQAGTGAPGPPGAPGSAIYFGTDSPNNTPPTPTPHYGDVYIQYETDTTNVIAVWQWLWPMFTWFRWGLVNNAVMVTIGTLDPVAPGAPPYPTANSIYLQYDGNPVFNRLQRIWKWDHATLNWVEKATVTNDYWGTADPNVTPPISNPGHGDIYFQTDATGYLLSIWTFQGAVWVQQIRLTPFRQVGELLFKGTGADQVITQVIGTATTPATNIRVEIELQAAGGGGGRGAGVIAGSGGGGGFHHTSWVVPAGETFTITLGKFGAGGILGQIDGGTANPSDVKRGADLLARCTGGSGGTAAGVGGNGGTASYAGLLAGVDTLRALHSLSGSSGTDPNPAEGGMARPVVDKIGSTPIKGLSYAPVFGNGGNGGNAGGNDGFSGSPALCKIRWFPV